MVFLFQHYREFIRDAKNFASIKKLLNDIILKINKITNLNKSNIEKEERLNKRNNEILLYKIIKKDGKYIL